MPKLGGCYIFFIIGAAALTAPAVLDSSFRTQVSLTVKYRRLLDPAWYLGPMQRLAARQSDRYLIDTIIARKDG